MKIFFAILLVTVLYAENDRSFDCNRIFEERKSELILELDKIDEQQQALEALQHATQKVLDAKEEKVRLKELEIDEKLKKIQEAKNDIKDIYAKNEEVLKEISRQKDDKIIEAYSKMKEGPAAAVISEMKDEVAASIMFNLTPKQASKIFSKMSPQKAARLTELLKKGPPYAKEQ